MTNDDLRAALKMMQYNYNSIHNSYNHPELYLHVFITTKVIMYRTDSYTFKNYEKMLSFLTKELYL